MPNHHQGFWMCQFCASCFTTFEEARDHEYTCTSSIAAPQPGFYDQYAAPAARAPQGAAFSSPSHFSAGGRSLGFQRHLFLGQNDANLTRDDATMCRNIELFELDMPNAVDGAGVLLPLGSVGLRCIHCSGGTQHSTPGNANFPRSVAEMGDFLRAIAEHHLWCCDRAPDSVKQTMSEALATRQAARQEGGKSWLIQENNRRLLLDYVAYRTRELGLMDKFPSSTGVIIRADVSPRRQPQQQPTPQPPNTARRTDSRQDPSAGTTPVRNRQLAPSSLPPDPPVAAKASQLEQDPSAVAGRKRIAQFNPRQQRQDSKGQFAPPSLQGGQPSVSTSNSEPNTFDATPIHFPFVLEPSGNWVCKFCQKEDPQQRDQYFQWAASNQRPPPTDYMEHHLRRCRMYQQNLMQEFRTPVYQQPNSASSYHPPFPQPDPLPPPMMQTGAPQPSSLEFEPGQLPFATSSNPTQSVSTTTPRRDFNADTPANGAMLYLDTHNMSAKYSNGTVVPDHLVLVTDDDRLLLSDYYFFVMKQLRHCIFAESDRKTRGGKRDNIEIGFGGFQCVHCANHPNSRKFFWSGVDRLANSFAEIPRHILGQCRSIPKETKNALETLKATHQEQMSRLPRGSQKVYFRRMWRRIHGPDVDRRAQQPELETPRPTNSAPASEPTRPERLDPFTTEKLGSAIDSPATQNSEESVLLLERGPVEAARALADSAVQVGPPSPTSRVLLSIPNDKEWLSDNDIFVRQQVEVFCATREDVQLARIENKHPIEEGTVGIRCIHCALSKSSSSENSTVYPFSIGGIFEAVQEFHRVHLDNCKNISPAVQSKLAVMKGYSSLTSVSRNWYVQAAKSLGLVDTKNGIRATGESAQLSSRSLFSFSDGNLSQVAASTLRQHDDSPTLTPRKRSSSHPSHPSMALSDDNKRPAYDFDDFQGVNERTSARLKTEDSPSSFVDASLERSHEATSTTLTKDSGKKTTDSV